MQNNYEIDITDDLNINLDFAISIIVEKTNKIHKINRNQLIFNCVRHMITKNEPFNDEFYLEKFNVTVKSTFSRLFKGHKIFKLTKDQQILSLGKEIVHSDKILSFRLSLYRHRYLKEIWFNASKELFERYYPKRYTFFPCGSLASVEWGFNNFLHSKDEPAKITYYPDGKEREIFYCQKGVLSHGIYPAYQKFFPNGNKWIIEWHYDGKLHKKEGYASEEYDTKGNVIKTSFLNGNKVEPGILSMFF